MTRKRFIKRVMAKGYQRNQAAKMADKVKLFRTYENTYEALHVVLIINRTGMSFKQFESAVGRAALAISNFAKSYREVITE